MGFAHVLVAFAVGVLGLVAGWIAKAQVSRSKIADAETIAARTIAEAEKEAANIKKEKLLEAKDEWYRLKQDFETDTKTRRKEITQAEQKLQTRESNIERRGDLLNQKEKDLQDLQKELGSERKELDGLRRQLEAMIEEENSRLQKISGMSAEEAKVVQIENMIETARQEAAILAKEIKDKAKQQANREAREIVLQSIQRSAADHSVETTVSVVSLPSDEMKGRIIGREGRNIRAFEQATGIEVIVDDTPEAVILSGFDPLRREIAKTALEKLIADGRIHPARIEEVVAKAQEEVDERITEYGEQALLEAELHGLHEEIVRLLGKLNYRTSYGQNILRHSIEVANLTGLMAAQLGLDATLARRAGLLHDIGKAVDRYMEGTHLTIGVELARKYGENETVVNAIAAHHGDEEAQSPIAVLVQAADSISGSRPGARRDTLEGYIRRLSRLEELATSFDGVSKSYAIQAGREVRVMAEHETLDDAQAAQLASEIARKIQDKMEYPGQIKVTVIREFRAVDYAK